jgi:hypothetical protein
MIYVRTVQATYTGPLGNNFYPAGIYSFTDRDRIPLMLQYSSNLIFEEDSNCKQKVRFIKLLNAEPTEAEIIFLVLQSKFVR